jgi:hypothetical protein
MRLTRPRAALGIALLALALVLALLAFIPWATWLGFARERETAALESITLSWLVWTPAIAVVAVAARLGLGSRLDAALENWLQKLRALPALAVALAFAVAAAAAGVLLSAYLFERNPHLVDTIAQLFQARIFLAGDLTAAAPDHPEFFLGQHLVRHGGRWFSQYPPGQPALLAAGLAIGAPWLINPLFAAGTIALVYAAARRLLGEGSARLAAALYLVSPFALFMSASYMNHITTGFFLALALYGSVRAVEDGAGRVGWAVVAGLALGLAGLIRPLESAAWAAVLGFWMLLRGGWRPAVAAGAACVLAVSPLLAYNAATTGDALRFGYTLLWGDGHGLGFHIDPWGEPFTPLKSFAMTALDLQRLNAFLFEWPFPSLLFAIAGLVVAGWDRRRRAPAALLAALAFAAPFAYFFYWHRDDYLGPRFLFASVIPLILLTALGVVALDERAGRWRGAFRVAVLTGMLCALALNVPESAGVIAGRLPGMKLHPDREAREAGVERALVFVKVGWGNRLISLLWSWGVSATETERTFRTVDGCRLEEGLREADSLSFLGVDSAAVLARLSERLSAWRELELPVVYERWPEPSVRFDTTRALPELCAREVREDTRGFTLYGNLVWHNDPWLREGVVYARDLGPERNRMLMDRYPDRPYFTYGPLSGEPGAKPVLRPLAPAPGATLRSPADESRPPPPALGSEP